MKYTIGTWEKPLIKTRKASRIPLPAKALSLLLSLVLACYTSAFAGDAILSWNPNTESDLAGYNVYFGAAPGVYGLPIDVGNQTIYTVTGLGLGTFYFSVTAYDMSGNESAFSSEASKTFTSADTTPPVISAIAATSITSNSASITWTTNETSDTQVQYGTTTSYGLSTSLNTSLVTAHSQGLTSLLPSTTYNYRVISRDAAGNIATSGNNTFTTLAAPDTIAPAISGITSSNVTSNGATIIWTTSETSDTQVQYGTTTAYGFSTTRNTSLVTLHSQGLTGLLPSTLYHFRVLSQDAAGNLATSGDNIFTTAPAPDTTAPVISGIVSSNITSSSAVITWSTNEGTTSQVEYGTTTAYGLSSTLNSTLVTSHSRSLSGLSPSTAYHYRVISRDAAGNLATSGDNIFTTAPAPDTTAPVISGIVSSNITSSSAVITWSTNEAATSQVEYGTTTAYGLSSTLNSTLITSHSRSLSGLLPSTTYHYRVISRDAAGNTATSGNNTFITTATPDTTSPIVSNISVINISSTGATVTWTTNEAATSQVEYGITTLYGNASATNLTLVTSHSRALSGLTPSSAYHFRVSSRDASGNITLSTDRTFTTPATPDTTGPVISGLVADAAANSAVIQWNTDEPATTQIEYGPTTAYGSSTPLNATLSISHAQTIPGLLPSTLYHYRVRSADAAGNIALSTDRTFTTLATPPAPDTTGPVISRVVANATTDSAIVQWNTDELATTQIEYGPTTAYGNSPPKNATLSISHTQTLPSLLPNTLYHYRVMSADATGNLSVSADQVFTTLNISDTTPPGDIQSFTAKGLNRMVQLSWVSPSDPDFAGVLIRYRIDGSYPETETDGFPVGDFKGLPAEPNKADHTGLQNNVIYYYSAFTYDTQGNYSRTAKASATPSEDSIQEPLSPKEAGGCGMILPKGGGNPPGPGDAADFLILIGFIVLMWIKKAAAACRPGSNEPFCT